MTCYIICMTSCTQESGLSQESVKCVNELCPEGSVPAPVPGSCCLQCGMCMLAKYSPTMRKFMGTRKHRNPEN